MILLHSFAGACTVIRYNLFGLCLFLLGRLADIGTVVVLRLHLVFLALNFSGFGGKDNDNGFKYVFQKDYIWYGGQLVD
jgi:hypothetical protein